jgi:hypothetical protein
MEALSTVFYLNLQFYLNQKRGEARDAIEVLLEGINLGEDRLRDD